MWKTESCLGKRSPVWGNGVLSGKTESCLGKQSPVWGNGVLFGETESCLGKRSPVWENGVLFGKTESCLGKRSPVWENRALSGKTESWLERPLEDSPQGPLPSFPSLRGERERKARHAWPSHPPGTIKTLEPGIRRSVTPLRGSKTAPAPDPPDV